MTYRERFDRLDGNGRRDLLRARRPDRGRSLPGLPPGAEQEGRTDPAEEPQV
jgi:hypothetical protein